jgi:hypothetical protein
VFVDGFTSALWVAVGFSAVGVIAALLTGARPQQQTRPGLGPEIAVAGDPA